MAHPSKRKGTRIEYELRDRLRAMGWVANRVPLSGAAKSHGTPFAGDVECEIPSRYPRRFKWESKLRKGSAGFKMVTKWLADHDFLYLREQGKPDEALVVMPWRVFEELMK